MSNPFLPRSDIYIDREGHWYYRGSEMTRREIVRLFYQNLFQDEAGKYSVRIGRQNCPIQAEDTAYVVWGIQYSPKEKDTDARIFLQLSDDRWECLIPETLRIGKNNVPYCRVRDNRFEARFSKHSYYQLTEYIEYDPDRDSFFLALNGVSYYIPSI